MPRLADATAHLKTDNSELKKGLDSGEQEVSGWGGRLGSVMQGVGMAVGLGVANVVMDAAGKVGQFMADSVGAASDLNETVSKTGVVFAENSAAVLAWAENASSALGQSKQGALDAASTFGNLFVSMGMAAGPSADMSMNLVQLASDLASFNNIDPAVALEKLRAGMLGQSEPMQALGVNMTAAMVSAKALEMGLAATTEELTPAMLAQARYALILEQTKTAQGDFARTSDGLANQQRIVDAQWKDLSATIGQGLLPVQLALTTALNDLLKAVLPPLAAFMTSTVVPAMAAMGEVIRSTVGPAIEWIRSIFTGFGATLDEQTNGPMAYLHAWFETNMPRIQAIVEAVLGAIQTFWDEHGAAITAFVTTFLDWMVRFWGTQFETILDVVQVILQVLTGDFEGAGNTIRLIVSRWWEFFRDAFNAIRRTITSIDWGAVGEAVVDAIWDGMQASWGGLQSWFDDRLQEMRNMLPFSEPKDPASPLRGLAASGEAIVDQIRSGIERAGALVPPALGMQPQAMAAGAGAPISITLNITGGDAAGIGISARDGVLAGLRAAGVR